MIWIRCSSLFSILPIFYLCKTYWRKNILYAQWQHAIVVHYRLLKSRHISLDNCPKKSPTPKAPWAAMVASTAPAGRRLGGGVNYVIGYRDASSLDGIHGGVGLSPDREGRERWKRPYCLAGSSTIHLLCGACSNSNAHDNNPSIWAAAGPICTYTHQQKW